MDDVTEKIILKEYKKGKSSLEIVKIVGLSKSTILKVLRKYNVIRKRDRCKLLKINQINGSYIIERVCPKCKEKILTKSKDKAIACRNHFNKLKENRNCKKCSLILQVGENNPFFGKKHSKETKSKISKSRKGKATGEGNAMSNPKHKEKVVKKFIDRIKSNPIKYSSRSKTEKLLYEDIKKFYSDTIHSKIINSYICDIYIPQLNLIIEYNGDYWHCNPKKYKPDYYHKVKNKTAKEIWEYDSKKIDLIKKKGYNLEIMWESDFNRNPNMINSILEKYVKKN